jgi:hypothetical protein
MDFKLVVDKLLSTKDQIQIPRYEVHSKNDILQLWSEYKEFRCPSPRYTFGQTYNEDIKYAINQQVIEITDSVCDRWNEFGFFDSLKPTFYDRVFSLVNMYATVSKIPDEEIDLDDSDDDIGITST